MAFMRRIVCFILVLTYVDTLPITLFTGGLCNTEDVDDVQHQRVHGRQKRYTVVASRRYRQITYDIDDSSVPTNISSVYVHDAIRRAMTLWEQYGDVRFVETVNASREHLHVAFHDTRAHDPMDNFICTPAGCPIAHATYPHDSNGCASCYMHFSIHEDWTESNYHSLYMFAVHELGHSLGIGHSYDRPESVMYPWFNYANDFSYDDILAAYVNVCKWDLCWKIDGRTPLSFYECMRRPVGRTSLSLYKLLQISVYQMKHRRRTWAMFRNKYINVLNDDTHNYHPLNHHSLITSTLTTHNKVLRLRQTLLYSSSS